MAQQGEDLATKADIAEFKVFMYLALFATTGLIIAAIKLL